MQNRSNTCSRPFVWTRNTTIIAALLAALSLPAAAQMQIPNPLIRPRSLANPGQSDTRAEPAAARGSSATAANTAPVPYTAGGTGTADDPFIRTMSDLKARFSYFYVSAIVGKQAILRRFQGDQRGSAQQSSQSAAPATNGAMAAIPLNPSTGSGAGYSRSDSLHLSDGEMLDMAGNSGALVAKVTGRQVTIYLVQETAILPGGKLTGKRTAIFSGEVENSGMAAAAAIILERPDPAYKRMITVETRTRSASSAQDAGSNTAPGATSGTAGSRGISGAPQ